MKPSFVLVALLALLPAACVFPPPAPETAAVSGNPAVTSLLAAARRDAAAGNYDAAAGDLERALRIEPRNARLWQALAQLRFAQAHYDQAENLAAKSNLLAGPDKLLRADNWRLIGRARASRGDNAGAEAAFRRADALVGQ